jgi:hypothetical protein
MPHRIKIHQQNKAIYWQARQFFAKRVTFNVFKRLFLVRHRVKEEDVSANILKHSLRPVLSTGLYAAAFVFAIEYFSHLAKNITFTMSNSELGLLISTVVTVTGVFLGLYITALSAVAGSYFMRAPQELQELFLRNRKGKQYIQTLALTTVVGIYYLLLRSFGYNVGFLGPIFIAILALYAVVRFIALGGQTFYFLHHGESSSIITNDAAQAVDNATAGRLGWRQVFLQAHNRKQARTALKTLDSLVDFGVGVIKFSDQQLLDVAGYTGGLLDYYLPRKKHIPSEREWFATKQKHQNWLLADSTALTMALNTGGSLAPKTSKDNTWFENKCLSIMLKILHILVEKGEWDSAYNCVEIIISTLDKVSAELYLDEAKLIIQRVGEALVNIAVSSANASDDAPKRGQLAFIDSLGRLANGLLVGLMKHLDKRTCQDLTQEIANTKWSGKKSIYTSNLPGKILIRLETTKKGLDIEKAMEGHRISPDWYITTITTQQYLQELKAYYDYIKSLQDTVFKTNVEALMTGQKYLHAAHLTERWLEFCNKMLTCGAMLEKLVMDCEGNKKVLDLPWPDFNFEAERAALTENDKQANDKLLELVPILAALPQPDLFELPDYFGQAYTFGVMAAFQAAHDDDVERLKKAFPAILIGTLKAHDLLLKETEGWSDESKIIFSTEPLEDLLVLSGFIKIYAELYDNAELWNICKNAWDRYLSATDATAIIKTLVAFTTYRDGVYKIMPKATIRHNWDVRLRSKLEELGLSVDPFPNPLSGSQTNVSHASPLVRVIARRAEFMDFAPRAVFYTSYFKQHEAASEIEFPDRDDIEDSLSRETGGGDE